MRKSTVICWLSLEKWRVDAPIQIDPQNKFGFNLEKLYIKIIEDHDFKLALFDNK